MVRGRPNPRHLRLPERLKKARRQAGTSLAGLSALASVANNAAMHIESGGRTPGIDVAEKLARALDVSPCWLAYGVEGPPVVSDVLRSKEVGARLKQARESASLSKKALAEAANVSRGMILYIEGGKAIPSVAIVEQLARGLDVSPCWLAFGQGEGSGVPIDPEV